MRDIEFRAKMLHDSEWVFGFVKKHTNNVFIINNKFTSGIEVDCKTVGQYTGKKDHDGTKIFEGDIVYCEFEDEYYKICWDDDDSKFSIHTLYDELVSVFDFSHYFGKDFEVIGNIYDNPELLKGGA